MVFWARQRVFRLILGNTHETAKERSVIGENIGASAKVPKLIILSGVALLGAFPLPCCDRLPGIQSSANEESIFKIHGILYSAWSNPSASAPPHRTRHTYSGPGLYSAIGPSNISKVQKWTRSNCTIHLLCCASPLEKAVLATPASTRTWNPIGIDEIRIGRIKFYGSGTVGHS